MKKLITLIALVCAICTSCKKPPKPDNNFPNPFAYNLTDSVQGTKDQLYVKAYSWMAKTFNSAKDVIQMQDKEAGKLIGKGVMTAGDLRLKADNYVNYTILIQCKDGRYKCEISDFNQESEFHSLNPEISNSIYGNKPYNSIKRVCQQNSKSLLESLKQAMHSNSDNF